MRTVDGASATDDLALASTEPMPLPKALPQSPQNFAPGAFSAPHFGQPRESPAPHSEQNFFAAGFSEPQFEQRIVFPGNRLDTPSCITHHPKETH